MSLIVERETETSSFRIRLLLWVQTMRNGLMTSWPNLIVIGGQGLKLTGDTFEERTAGPGKEPIWGARRPEFESYNHTAVILC